jgi:hypothetical protein
MNAAESAARILDWAVAGSGPRPRGVLRDPETLLHPQGRLAEALGELARVTAARLRLGSPPLGDAGPIGPGAALLAAALGVAHLPELAQALVRSLLATENGRGIAALALDLLAGKQEEIGPAEWVVRHGITGRALETVTGELADDFRRVSPLTALLDRPAPGQQAEALEVAHRLVAHPSGRLALTLALARPARDPEVLRWRKDLLESFLLEPLGRDFVLDVYEAALVHHEAEWLGQVRSAGAVLTDPVASADDRRLNEALSAAAWWGPLSALARTDLDALRSRRYLGYRYREGLALHSSVKSWGACA